MVRSSTTRSTTTRSSACVPPPAWWRTRAASGNGEQIAANKVAGVRAALAWSEETARLAREHNDANVLSVGGRMHPVDDMTHFVEVFLSTAFTGEERHVRRIAMLSEYERSGRLPALPASAAGLGPDA
jgi:ribose 5-phosphate isomerase B